MSGSGDKRKKRAANLITRDTAVASEQCRKYFEMEKAAKQCRLVQQPVERKADCFDISARTVIGIRKRLEQNEPFNDEGEREREVTVPDTFVRVVRETIANMYATKERVTLDTLLKKLTEPVKTRSTIWVWSRSTLHRFLVEKMRYTYGDRRSHYQDLKEEVSIAAQRIAYIKNVRAYRAEGRAIFYQEEAWANKNMTPARIWLDEDGKGGLKTPSGKGERSLICHIGGESGFVEGAKLIFRGESR